MNFLNNLINVLWRDQPISGLITAALATLFLTIILSITYLRFPAKSKYAFLGFFIASCVFNALTAWNFDTTSVFHVEKVLSDCYLRFTVIYIMTMAFFSYCEFQLCFFVYTPLYIASCYTTQRA